ncbi:MAG: hypothetical protein AAFM91_00745 [Pseudomonadota bacterium]
MRKRRQSIRAVCLLTVTTALAACGGGGGSDGPPANRAPVASAGADQSVDPQALVTLAGSGSDQDGSVATFAWAQISGPNVTLADAGQASTTFTAPNVAASETLGFRLTVTDDDGATGSDDVVITVAVNQAPTANAGADQTVQEGTLVTLSGSGMDADGTIAAYAWTQVAGPAVTLSDPNAAIATFTAPPAGGGIVLRFELVVTDDDGVDSAADLIDVNVIEQIPANVTISGGLQFEFVERASAGNGLDYNNVSLRPIRGATVEGIDVTTQQVLATTVSDGAGAYALQVPSQRNVFVRVRAELKRSGTPSWDMEVRDNTSNTAQPLAARPIYALDGSAADSGVADSTRNLVARTGWGGASYTAARASAPFAVLDTMYEGIQLVLSVEPNAVFATLDAFWSVNNCPTSGNIDTGDIGTSFYRPDLNSMFLLGCAGVDTEEFDSSVIAHEWGHYFEDALSRTDSIGGRHSGAERLDMRLAFGEGWGNAVAGMIIGNSIYRDSFGAGQGTSFQFDVESNTATNPGWYNEFSIQSILYDLYDADADGVDTINLGFAPLYEVLIGEQRVTPAFTSVFSFLTALKDANPGSAAVIDALATAQSIDGPQMDIYGSFETNNAGSADILPIYETIGIGTNATICLTRQFDPNGDRNKLGLFRFLRLSAPAARTYNIVVSKAATPAVGEATDPDVYLYQNGVLLDVSESVVPDSESASFSVAAGDYVIEIFEFNTIAGTPPAATRICYDVSVS